MSVTRINGCVYSLSVPTVRIPRLILIFTDALVLIVVLMHNLRPVLAHPKDAQLKEGGCTHGTYIMKKYFYKHLQIHAIVALLKVRAITT